MGFSTSQEKNSKELKGVIEKSSKGLSKKLMGKIEEELDKRVAAIEEKLRK